MRTIHKAVLKITDAQVLQLPRGAKILTAQMQMFAPSIGTAYEHKQLCIWYECDPAQEKEPRAFVIVGTGHYLPDTHKLAYIATVQDGAYVWHIYSVLT